MLARPSWSAVKWSLPYGDCPEAMAQRGPILSTLVLQYVDFRGITMGGGDLPVALVVKCRGLECFSESLHPPTVLVR